MPRQVTPLSNTQIAKAKPQDKEYNLADGRGLYLRVMPQGSKRWIFNYLTPFAKKRTNISLGAYPEVKLIQARAEREKCRELLTRNIDPKSARSQRHEAEAQALQNTLRSVAERWFEIKSAELTAGYAADIWNSLENHVFPELGKRPVHQISARDVADVLRPLEKQGKLELVKRICQRLSAVMDHAVIAEYVEENRLLRVGRLFKSPSRKHLPTVPPEELPRLVESIQEASVRPVTRFLILWQLHTMVRPSEAAGARWSEISDESRLWTIPAERMKRRRQHLVPLSDQCMQILTDIRPLSGHREFIFPSDHNPRKSANSATVNMALRRMGYHGKLVSHGFRSLASTILNEEGFEPDLVETALSHLDKNTTRAAYNRTDYLERRRGMMDWWSDCIQDAATLITVSRE